MLDPFFAQELFDICVLEFGPIVSSHLLDLQIKLILISPYELLKAILSFTFITQKENPGESRKIINNGTEFKNTGVEEFLGEEGIKHEFSCPYTPQQNGVVERKNRTLIEAARTMLDEYKTPDNFWAEAVNTACHAINRLYLQIGRAHV